MLPHCVWGRHDHLFLRVAKVKDQAVVWSLAHKVVYPVGRHLPLLECQTENDSKKWKLVNKYWISRLEICRPIFCPVGQFITPPLAPSPRGISPLWSRFTERHWKRQHVANRWYNKLYISRCFTQSWENSDGYRSDTDSKIAIPIS